MDKIIGFVLVLGGPFMLCYVIISTALDDVTTFEVLGYSLVFTVVVYFVIGFAYGFFSQRRQIRAHDCVLCFHNGVSRHVIWYVIGIVRANERNVYYLANVGQLSGAPDEKLRAPKMEIEIVGSETLTIYRRRCNKAVSDEPAETD